MQISITDPVYQTTLFTIILIALTALSIRKDSIPHEMSHSYTDELKGLAVLMIVFSHIGYFLFTDHRFLFPLSVSAGVGVNIFLVLSGFGLTLSANKKKLGIFEFYKKRFKNIFIPMWIVFSLIILLDYFLLNKTYGTNVIIRSLLGFYPYADIYLAINSPLWYFSFILFYYLMFPLVYSNKRKLISVLVVLVLSYFVTTLKLPIDKDVLKLYKLHFLAFPLGMFIAYVKDLGIGKRFRQSLSGLFNKPVLKSVMKYIFLVLLSIAFGYTAIHSGIGEKLIVEQVISIVSVGILLLVFLIKDFHSNLLVILGKYSYEIYLIQWPLMYRYDFIYKYVPAYLGTLLYIAVFIIIGFVLNKITKVLVKSD